MGENSKRIEDFAVIDLIGFVIKEMNLIFKVDEKGKPTNAK